MRTIREEPAAQRALDDALDRWSRTVDAWEAITRVIAREPEVGTALNESGTLRAYTLDGVRSLGLPTITVLYEIAEHDIAIHDELFTEARYADAGRS